MGLSQLNHKITHWLQSRFGRAMPEVTPPTREATTHVVILDGTMSTLDDGYETNAGLTYKLCLISLAIFQVAGSMLHRNTKC